MTSELTLGDLIGTENVADITDIGGIAGQSGGVIRACMNRGTVGYQHMGYNVGGIAGSQTGYIEGLRQLRHRLRPQGGRRHRRPDGAQQHAGIHQRHAAGTQR